MDQSNDEVSALMIQQSLNGGPQHHQLGTEPSTHDPFGVTVHIKTIAMTKTFANIHTTYNPLKPLQIGIVASCYK